MVLVSRLYDNRSYTASYPSGGESPAPKGPLEERVCTSPSVTTKDSGCEKARKTGETARGGAGISRRFTLARARGGAP